MLFLVGGLKDVKHSRQDSTVTTMDPLSLYLTGEMKQLAKWKVTNLWQSVSSSSMNQQVTRLENLTHLEGDIVQWPRAPKQFRPISVSDTKDKDDAFSKFWTLGRRREYSTKRFQILFDKRGTVHFLHRKSKQRDYLRNTSISSNFLPK